MKTQIIKLLISLLGAFIFCGCDIGPADSTNDDNDCARPIANARQFDSIVDLDGDGEEIVELNAILSEGDIVHYEWSENGQVIGTQETLLIPLSVGNHVIELLVENDCGNFDKGYLNIIIEPETCDLPSANAGNTINAIDDDGDGFAQVELDGSASIGDALAFTWFENEEIIGNDSILEYNFPLGSHKVTLSVTDKCEVTHQDTVYVNVNPIDCPAPKADAGKNVEITDENSDGIERVLLDGSGSVGDITDYQWNIQGVNIGVNETLHHDFDIGFHVVNLTVTNYCGSTANDLIYVNIASQECERPKANAGNSRTIKDEDDDGVETIKLDGSQSIGDIVDYRWSTKEGDIGTGEFLEYNFGIGLHTVTLTVTNNCGSTSKDVINVNVSAFDCPLPQADSGNSITLVDEDGDGEEAVELNGSSSNGNIIEYRWSTEDGEIGFGEILFHSFERGFHVVTLTVSNACGATANDVLYVSINPPECLPPVADAGNSVTVVDEDSDGIETVELSGSASSSDVVLFNWSTEGQEIETGQNAFYNFGVGVHEVTLSVTNDCGSIAKDVIYVNVLEEPSTCNPPVSKAGNSLEVIDEDHDGVEIVTLDGSKSTGNVNNFVWSEDNKILGQNVVVEHEFSTGGHAVTLSVTNECGTDKDAIFINVKPQSCESPFADAGESITLEDDDSNKLETVTLDGSASMGDISEFQWLLDGQELGSGISLEREMAVGTHIVTLITSNECGDSDRDAIYVHIKPKACTLPIADAGESLSIKDTDGDGNENATLSGVGSLGDIAAYRWSMSGEEIGTGIDITKDFPIGTHLITLTVTNECGDMDKDAVYVHVEPGECEPPMADAGANKTIYDDEGDGIETVKLDGTGSSENIIEYFWSVDGEEVGTDALMWHNFSIGTHLVTLTTINECGDLDKDAIYINVMVQACPTPIADVGGPIIVADADRNGSELINLNASASPGENLTYEWMVDGVTISTDRQTEQFFEWGVHLVTLIVTNECGASASDSTYVNVYNPDCSQLKAGAGQNIIEDDLDGDGVESVSLDGSNSTGQITAYEWVKDDKVIGNGSNILLDLDVGVHLITLIVTDDCGASSSDALYVHIRDDEPVCEPPVAEAGANIEMFDFDNDGRERVQLDGSSSINSISFKWMEDNVILGQEETLDIVLDRGIHLITLQTLNNCGDESKDAIIVAILPEECPALVADAGSDTELIDNDGDAKENYTLQASNSTGDILQYEWYEGDIKLGEGQILPFEFGIGSHFVMLKVTDDCGNLQYDDIVVNVRCPPLAAEALEIGTIIDSDGDGQETATLDGSDSTGNILTFEWFEGDSKIAEGATSEVILDVGSHIVTLLTTDSCGNTDQDSIIVGVEASSSNQTPVADAGVDQIILITETSAVPLNGGGSSDPDNDPLTYRWLSIDDRIDETAFDPSVTDVAPNVMLPQESGQYEFLLIVEDDKGAYDVSDVVVVEVTEPGAWADSSLSAQDGNRFPSIQEAIDFASANNETTVAVLSGTYSEQVAIKKDITLFGLTPEPQIRASVGLDQALVNMEEGAKLINFSVVCEFDAGDASKKAAVRIDGNNVSIEDCRIIDSVSDGIQIMSNIASASIENCLLNNISGEGIEALAGSGFEVNDTSIRNTAGTGIWADNSKRAYIENTVICHSGWHGIDFNNCVEAVSNHNTIVDFANTDESQSGIIVSSGDSITLTNNLVQIRDRSTLSGIQYNSYGAGTAFTYEYNYIYSLQPVPEYYRGELDLNDVSGTNYPNINDSATDDPLFIDHDNCDLTPNSDSPIIGLGEENSNPGASGSVLSF